MDAAPEQAVIEDLYRLIRDRQLIPVRVEECRLTGWLAAIAYLDLVGTSEPESRASNSRSFCRNLPKAIALFQRTL